MQTLNFSFKIYIGYILVQWQSLSPPMLAMFLLSLGLEFENINQSARLVWSRSRTTKLMLKAQLSHCKNYRETTHEVLLWDTTRCTKRSALSTNGLTQVNACFLSLTDSSCKEGILSTYRCFDCWLTLNQNTSVKAHANQERVGKFNIEKRMQC